MIDFKDAKTEAQYNADRTLGHREFWQKIFADVRADAQATAQATAEANASIDSLSEEELERLTRPEVQ